MQFSLELDSRDQCWPLLLHLEPTMEVFASPVSQYGVAVSDEGGEHRFRDVADGMAAAASPHRVTLRTADEYENVVTVWVDGFRAGGTPRICVAGKPLTHGQRYVSTVRTHMAELRRGIFEFLGRPEPAPAPEPIAEPAGATAKPRWWRTISEQPLAVQVVGGIIAAVISAGIVALVTALLT